MVEELVSGNTEFVEIRSNFAYVLGRTIGHVLDFKGKFEGMQWSHGDLEAIASTLERRAKEFAEAQRIYDTGNLIDNIRAYRDGNTVHLRTEARKHYYLQGGKQVPHYNPKSTVRTFEGGYYGAHVEFGHRTPRGGFYPARPYLRPALRIVSEQSKGELLGTVQALFSGTLSDFDSRGFSFRRQSIMFSGLTFGKSLTSKGGRISGFGSKTHQSGMSKLTGYNRLNSVSKQQKQFSENYSLIRGGKNNHLSNTIQSMSIFGSGSVQKGRWALTASREKVNPNAGQSTLNKIKTGRDPNYKSSVETRSLGSPVANRFYHNQQYQARQKAGDWNPPAYEKYLDSLGR